MKKNPLDALIEAQHVRQADEDVDSAAAHLERAASRYESAGLPVRAGNMRELAARLRAFK